MALNCMNEVTAEHPLDGGGHAGGSDPRKDGGAYGFQLQNGPVPTNNAYCVFNASTGFIFAALRAGR